MAKRKQTKSKEVPQDYCVECIYTDKATVRISVDSLEKLVAKAADSNKLPLIILGLKRSDKEMFIVKCHITTEKKGSK